MKYKIILFYFFVKFCQAQNEIPEFLSQKFIYYSAISDKIWRFSEPGYLEEKTSGALASELSSNGFMVKKGVGEMQTAFVASFGNGYPVIAILAEMDALPGLSQEAIPTRKPLALNGYGHGCGHNLF